MTARTDPLVSVLMASYDSAEFMAEGIESALGQTYANLEVVVADDRSGDDSVEIAEGYASAHPGRVTVVRGESNAGAWRNRNRAFLASSGELLCQLDPDDLWMPDKVERQVEVMRSRPEVGLVYTAFELFDSDTGERIDPVQPAERDGDLFEALWTDWNFIGAVSAMWRRSAMERRGVELWSCEPHVGDDYNLWLLISLDWQVAAIPDVLARYRRHSQNLTDLGDNPHLVALRILSSFADDYPEVAQRLGPEVRRRLVRERMMAGAYQARRGRHLRGAGMRLNGFARDPATAVRPHWHRLLTWARVTTRPLQPSHRRARRRVA